MTYGDILIGGRRLPSEFSDNITNAEIDLQTSQVAELTIDFDDPGFKLLSNGLIRTNIPVDYHGLGLVIAVVETNEGGGNGGVTIKCRPRAVQAMKNLRGARVMNNVSPSEYIAAEAALGHVRVVAEPSARRAQIARDVTEPGQQGNADSSAWSTFGRLASEIGYIVFEDSGVIYFGRPSYFVKTRPTHIATVGPSNYWRMDKYPKCRRSIDDNNRATVDAAVPLEHASTVRPGHVLRLIDVPQFSESFFVTGVNYSLRGIGSLTIEAETPHDPTPQNPDGE